MTSTPPTGTRPTDGAPEAWRGRARRAMTWASAAGAALALAAAAVAWSWSGELPAEAASHWSGSGVPDGFSTPSSLVLLCTALALGLVALFCAIGTLAGSAASTRRIAAAGSVWSGGFAGGLLLVTLAPQRGLDDASQVGLSAGAMALVLVAPLVPAVVAAMLVPGDPVLAAAAPVPSDAPRVAVRDGERVVWLRRATGGPGLAVGAVSILVTVALAVVTQTWGMLVVPVLLAGLFVAMFAFSVRVDGSGLTVRSVAGWPGTHVPAAEVLAASVVHVSPFREFGGWGWRVGSGGRVGVVLRQGEGLLVERSGGRSLVVTVDDAATAAALLNTAAERAR
ncbi:DUF1648 domain-containing protein [Isoptericola sp. NEAU-Y5]|uniref:DUF1648 domain-containing protein n=1 Tax=Isoptericola luteus TaxID=2879484 RepID=A0ABS7ZE50_9MICO|nr:DUF1648 domain-containing protein [Isoptericola sp. NEAU-Y5]MCA5893318.1 DUF1648 domain-containing protein [Isoptericola sp. NEAU-Y5]